MPFVAVGPEVVHGEFVRLDPAQWMREREREKASGGQGRGLLKSEEKERERERAVYDWV